MGNRSWADKTYKRIGEVRKMERKIVDNLKQVDYSGLLVPGIVVYSHPADVPDKIVARVWDVGRNRPTNVELRRDSLEDIRKEIREVGIFSAGITRDPQDVSCIVETWM